MTAAEGRVKKKARLSRLIEEHRTRSTGSSVTRFQRNSRGSIPVVVPGRGSIAHANDLFPEFPIRNLKSPRRVARSFSCERLD